MIQETYHQHASGEFSARLVAGSNHCGLSYGNGQAQLRFTVDIEYIGVPSPLDTHGFLLDNLYFQQYELRAEYIAMAVMNRLGYHGNSHSLYLANATSEAITYVTQQSNLIESTAQQIIDAGMEVSNNEAL